MQSQGPGCACVWCPTLLKFVSFPVVLHLDNIFIGACLAHDSRERTQMSGQILLRKGSFLQAVPKKVPLWGDTAREFTDCIIVSRSDCSLLSHCNAHRVGTLSVTVLAGFCGETEEEHAATLDLVERTSYDQAFMFAYSERSKTFASRHLAVRCPSWSDVLTLAFLGLWPQHGVKSTLLFTWPDYQAHCTESVLHVLLL